MSSIREIALAKAVGGGGGPSVTVEPLSVDKNGVYTAPAGNAYSPVTVEVSGGGGSGVVLTGTTAPTSDIGSNEDLYVQYSVHQGWDYLYGIDAIYRKVSGAWIAYVDPTDPNVAVHVWTQSAGGFDAAMYVQKASYDPITGTYTPVGSADIVGYKSVQGNTYDMFGLAELSYGAQWKIVASQTITDGVSTYNAGETVTTWNYNIAKDIYLRKA